GGGDALPVRAGGVLLRGSGLDEGADGVQPHGRAGGHVGEDREGPAGQTAAAEEEVNVPLGERVAVRGFTRGQSPWLHSVIAIGVVLPPSLPFLPGPHRTQLTGGRPPAARLRSRPVIRLHPRAVACHPALPEAERSIRAAPQPEATLPQLAHWQNSDSCSL